jgi:hypothetical protein
MIHYSAFAFTVSIAANISVLHELFISTREASSEDLAYAFVRPFSFHNHAQEERKDACWCLGLGNLLPAGFTL